jgi:putative NADH-flavin reductase
LINSVGLELTKAYLQKGWKVIAAVRDPSKMEIEGDVMVVKLEVGEKEDAKNVRPLFIFLLLSFLPAMGMLMEMQLADK